MTPSAQDRGKGAPVGPFSAAALAANVVDILVTLGAPVAGALKKWKVRRAVKKAIERVSSNFVGGHPETAEILAASAEAVAHELARLTGAGRPLASKILADEWTASGRLGRAEAGRYAAEYVQTLHDELLKIDGFRPLFAIGATISTAESTQRIEEATRARELQEVAVSYYDAADEYIHAALGLLEGDLIKAMRSVYDARSLIEKAELNGDWRVIERSKGLRARFGELVEERYDAVEAACAAGDGPATEQALEALERGSGEFKAFVKELLFNLSAPRISG